MITKHYNKLDKLPYATESYFIHNLNTCYYIELIQIHLFHNQHEGKYLQQKLHHIQNMHSQIHMNI